MKGSGPSSGEQITAGILAGSGIDARIVLTTREVIFARIVSPLDSDDVVTIVPWGTSEPRRLRRAEVKFASTAKVNWLELRKITREQREKYT